MVIPYTAVPNEILDRMDELSPAEFKVTMAIYRLIIGYKEYRLIGRRKISIGDLEKATKLSRQGVLNTFDGILKMGFLSKETEGRSTVWIVNSVDQLVQSVDQEGEKVGNSVDQDSKLSVPDVVKPVDYPPQGSFNKNKKQSPESNRGPNPFPYKPLKEKSKQESPAEKRKQAIIAVCGLDDTIPTHVKEAENATAQLKKYTAEYIQERYSPGGWWYLSDWRGQKGQQPTTSAVIETIAKTVQASSNGHHKTPAPSQGLVEITPGSGRY